MHLKRFTFGLSWLLALAVALSGGSAAVQAQVGTQATSLPNQLTGATFGGGAISANFTAQGKSGEAADDFNLATTGSDNFWFITNVTVRGLMVVSPHITSVNVRFYSGGASAPGALYALHDVSIANITVTPGLINNVPITFSIPVNVALVANNVDRKYWISVQATITDTTTATWSWASSSLAGTGTAESTYRNVGLDDGTSACSDNNWNLRVSICSIPSGTDPAQMAFALSGQSVYLQYSVYLPIIRR